VEILPPVLPVCTVPCAQHAEMGSGLNISRTSQAPSGSTPTQSPMAVERLRDKFTCYYWWPDGAHKTTSDGLAVWKLSFVLTKAVRTEAIANSTANNHDSRSATLTTRWKVGLRILAPLRVFRIISSSTAWCAWPWRGRERPLELVMP
jgi:hypothetical protein